jgi:HJR/Mrr/RecB family endonuclease
LYALEREFFAAERELCEAQAQLSAARSELQANPVSEHDIERFHEAKRQAGYHRQAYDAECNKLNDINAEISQLEVMARQVQRKLDRERMLYGGVGQGLVCAAEVVVVLLLSTFCLLSLPTAIWAILTTVLALGAVAITLIVFSLKQQSHSQRMGLWISDLASTEVAVQKILPSRDAAGAEVERTRDSWDKADDVLRDWTHQIRPWVRHERAREAYECIRQDYDLIEADYEDARTDRRLRLLRRDWRDLKADQFESFVREVFEALGYQTELKARSGDQGVDIIAVRDGVRWAIQCKGYAGTLGNKPIQEVFTGAHFHNCHRWLVITTSGFTSGGREAAARTGCVLVEGCDIPELIKGNLKL